MMENTHSAIMHRRISVLMIAANVKVGTPAGFIINATSLFRKTIQKSIWNTRSKRENHPTDIRKYWILRAARYSRNPPKMERLPVKIKIAMSISIGSTLPRIKPRK